MRRGGVIFFFLVGLSLLLPAVAAVVDVWAWVVVGHPISPINWTPDRGFVSLVMTAVSAGAFGVAWELAS
jgi:hypothetical protein